MSESKINRTMATLPAVLLAKKKYQDSGLPDRRNVPREKPAPTDDELFRYRTWTPAGPVSIAVNPQTLLREKSAAMTTEAALEKIHG